MANSQIYDEWTKFNEEYSDILMKEDEKWLYYLNQTKNFIIKNNRRPNKRSNDKNEKQIGEWIGKQLVNFNGDKGLLKKYPLIKEEFKRFYEEFSNFF